MTVDSKRVKKHPGMQPKDSGAADPRQVTLDEAIARVKLVSGQRSVPTSVTKVIDSQSTPVQSVSPKQISNVPPTASSRPLSLKPKFSGTQPPGVKSSAVPTESHSPSTAVSAPKVNEVIVGDAGPTEAGSHQVMMGMECLKKFQFQIIRKIYQPLAQTPDHFAIGTQLHAGKARWFSCGFRQDAETWASIQKAMRDAMEEEKLPVSVKALQAGERYMSEYIAYWSKMPRPSPIACEYKLGPTPLEPGDPFFTWRTARLDDVSRYPEGLNKLWLGETKTTSGTINQCIQEYTLHTQILLQMLLWKMDPGGEAKYGPIEGVMLDVIAKGYGDKPTKFQRHAIPVPAHALRWFPRTLKAHLQALAPINWDSDALRNPTACSKTTVKGTFACPYQQLCLHGKKATALYVMGKGESLLSWKPEPGKMVAPWE